MQKRKILNVAMIGYTLGVCALVGPGEMALPTPCADATRLARPP